MYNVSVNFLIKTEILSNVVINNPIGLQRSDWLLRFISVSVIIMLNALRLETKLSWHLDSTKFCVMHLDELGQGFIIHLIMRL